MIPDGKPRAVESVARTATPARGLAGQREMVVTDDDRLAAEQVSLICDMAGGIGRERVEHLMDVASALGEDAHKTLDVHPEEIRGMILLLNMIERAEGTDLSPSRTE